MGDLIEALPAPCPFCGGKPIVGPLRHDTFGVSCSSCFAVVAESFPSEWPEEIITKVFTKMLLGLCAKEAHRL